MGTRRSGTQSQHRFSQVSAPSVPRSKFNRSSGLKTAFNAGDLVPIYCDEALPGDTFSMRTTVFGRLATPIHPVMENLYMDVHYFAVPIRLIWDNWQKFNGEQTDPGDSTDYTVPQLVSDPSVGFLSQTIHDYLGLPIGVKSLSCSAFWHRAYNLIWNEWFRDENLQDSVTVQKDDGPDVLANYTILKRGKRHDYFTSCLPWPQKGTEVSLPLGTSAPVSGTISGTGAPTFIGAANPGTAGTLQGNSTATLVQWQNAIASTGAFENADWVDPKLSLTSATADLSSATAATINDLREAFQLQKLYERDARGGTRYTEILRSHFGVVSPDQRLQRPEFLGGGTATVTIHPVAQTSETGTTPQGELAAFGTVSNTGMGFTKSFVEHCVIIGLASVRADLNYQQGLNRMWSRSTRYDFYWPSFAHLGEQAVLNKEIYAQGSDDPAADAAVFGYQERYAEYRYKPSQVTGRMRSASATPLDSWHLAQDFSALPVLNDSFIQENPPIDRIVAVTSEPDLLLDAFFDLQCARPMPVYSVPGLIDHF